ncbi:MAG: hypothetical protein A2172_03725 [Candidatus Woykebacteria bacterium RBG_13_40_15]|uniref:Uncharacterized protein n=1 Tax=Candidatus Woykebacteria bacterium RBG_13_40_15 TaxID=1802593 RepID=A0A1G1W7F8_9BACT|nr:MAG: hypothetical protein A2172_03725 [Candidatus Woykebacteria bacterium RBG_13_40_15]
MDEKLKKLEKLHALFDLGITETIRKVGDMGLPVPVMISVLEIHKINLWFNLLKKSQPDLFGKYIDYYKENDEKIKKLLGDGN